MFNIYSIGVLIGSCVICQAVLKPSVVPSVDPQCELPDECLRFETCRNLISNYESTMLAGCFLS